MSSAGDHMNIKPSYETEEASSMLNVVEKGITQLEHQLCRHPSVEEIAGAVGIGKIEYLTMLEAFYPLSLYQEGDQNSAMNRTSSITGTEHLPEALVTNLAKAIESLPNEEREVITAFFLEELNHTEIGTVLNLRDREVCQLHSQGMLRLKAYLRAAGYSFVS